jgi:RNA polymerase sigma factor (sigma-70 family)
MSDRSQAQAEWIRNVLREHEAPLLRYALRLTGDAESARDIVQETFMRLCRAEQATIDGHVGPWLFRVCRQRALDQQRKERRMPTSASHTLDNCSATGPGPAEQREQVEAGQDILRLLTTLPAKQQEVVRLKFQAGLSYREISEVTDLSVSNVGFLLHTALARLRESLATADASQSNGEISEPAGSRHHAKPGEPTSDQNETGRKG